MTALVLSDTRNWKRSIDAISALISEGSFDFAEKGVAFSAVDPSQVAFVDFFMPKSCFQEYSVSNVSVGLDLIELSKVVSRALPTDRLTISVEASDFLLKLQGTLTRRFKLPLLDLSSDDAPKPKQEFSANVEVNAKLLKEAFKDASLFSSSVVLRVDGDRLLIESQGAQGNLKTIVPSTNNIKVESSEEVISKYSLNFLSNILREADSGDVVKLSLKSEAPLKVTYPIGDARISYFLAPMLL